MRVVVAPDKFAGTLTAPEAARAIAEGWLRRAPADRLDLVPMSDGGPGFVDVLHEALGGELLACTVSDLYGANTPATVLVAAGTAWIESAQVIGLALRAPHQRDPMVATSRGLGELLEIAVDTGVSRVVVGLGGSGTNDAGAGMLAALGATADVPLDRGPAGLAGLSEFSLGAALERLRGVEIVAATDVEHMLLGLVGATKTFGPQKGLSEDQLLVADARLQRLAELANRKLADAKGAGAAGGVGYGLMLCGAVREPGVDLVASAVGLADRLKGADLAITGEGSFDFSSRAGKVPYGVAQLATDALAPCVVIAGQVEIGSRETRAIGVESAYSVSELVGLQRSLASPYDAVTRLAERVARTWSR